MSFAEEYKTNLAEAQHALDNAQSAKDECKRIGLIEWGRTKRGYEGWLVKGKRADLAFSAWVKAKAEVDHWGSLLNDEIRGGAIPDVRLPPEHDDEEAPF